MRATGKKGFTGVEWAISSALFLLFIAWFFIILQPTLAPAVAENRFALFEQGVQKRLHQIEVLPVMVTVSNGSSFEPIILKNPSNSSQTLLLAGKQTAQVQQHLVFLDWPHRSADSLIIADASTIKDLQDPPAYPVRLLALESYADTGIRVDFENMSPTRLSRGVPLITGFRTSINGVDIRSITSSKLFTVSGFHAQYQTIAPSFNATVLVFGNNSKMYQLLTVPANVSVVQRYDLELPDQYYADNAHMGPLPQPDCVSFEGDYLWLKDTYNLHFYFPERGLIRLCVNGSDSHMTYACTDSGNLLTRIEVNKNTSVEGVLRKPAYAARFGIQQKAETLLPMDLAFWRNATYEQLRQEFGSSRDFKMVIELGDLRIEKGKAAPATNVFTKSYYYPYLSNPQQVQTMKITFLTW